jgi:hypothetical protein
MNAIFLLVREEMIELLDRVLYLLEQKLTKAIVQFNFFVQESMLIWLQALLVNREINPIPRNLLNERGVTHISPTSVCGA